MEQIVGKTSYEKPCLIGCETVATRFVPSERVLALFYPVFDLNTTVVDRNYFVRLKIRVGHDKSDTGEKFTHVPFDFTDNPSRFIPFLRLVMKLNHPYLNSTLWGTAGRPLQMGFDELLEAIVAGKPNEVSDPLLFAKLVQVWTGKGRIPPEPKLLEPRPIEVNQRRDKVHDAIG